MSMNGVLRSYTDDGFDLGQLGTGDLEGPASFASSTEVDKMWQALSVLTTPGADPLGSIIDPDPLDPLLGGSAFGEDLGYGEARHLPPDQVRAVHDHLSSLADADVRTRFDPAAFGGAGVYPFVWDEDPDELWAEVLVHLAAIRRFYADAATNGHHVVLCLE